MSLLVRFAARASSRCAATTTTASSSAGSARRRFADAVAPPVRREVSKEERVLLRAARKKQASDALAKERGTSSSGGGAHLSAARIKYVWYLGVLVPTGLFAWAYNDENSPPAYLFRMVGLTGLITSYTDEISKPAHEKLLPDWNQVSSL
jgi:hypothetical protein